MIFKLAWLKSRYFLLLSILSCLSYLYLNNYIWFPEKDSMKIGTTENQESCDLPLGRSQYHQQAKKKFKRLHNLTANTKILLLYTGLFFHPWWWHNTEEELHRYTYTKNCRVQNCYFSYDKETFNIADAVIFHGVDINKPYCLRKLSEKRPRNQKWILFMHESPIYTIDLKPYNGMFNWTMTYMRKSEIYVPYFSYEKLRHGGPRPKRNFAAGKFGKAVWVVSHCGLIRDDYALELEKYIDLKVYGGCGEKFKNNMGRCSDWGTQCEDEIKKYKFYLAFENCFCEDYITEKFWEKGLKYGLIPVFMGGMDKTSNVIPGSYIDVNNFDSIKSLAKYLLHLDVNDTAYNEYFNWRHMYQVTSGIDSFCEVCKALHDSTIKNNVYLDLTDFWSVTTNCHKFNWKIKDIKSQISKSRFRFQESR